MRGPDGQRPLDARGDTFGEAGDGTGGGAVGVTARLLFVGDIHLGRVPSRLPANLADLGLTAAELSPAAAWRATVERAIALDVDAVVLAGDVVDRLEDRFEAHAPLRAGVQRLVDAEVPVFGVAGNHDVEALPRLARQIPAFRLLGERGSWQAAHVSARSRATARPGDDDGEAGSAAAGDVTGVRLVGWSFPSERVRTSPLESLRIGPEPGIATLGVLHCDLDAGSSPYAPVARAALRAVPFDGWLLGHVHRPDALDEAVPIGYLGSLVGLDPGEPGRRGPWLVDVEGPGRVRASQIALAPIRYERAEVELSASAPGASVEDVQDEAFAALSRGLTGIADRMSGDDDQGALRLVACRLSVSGPGRHEPAVRAVLDLSERHPTESRSGAHYYIESLEERARPDLDLESIAIGDDPPALLARRLLALQRGGADAEALVASARQRLDAALAASRWQRLDTSPGTTPDAIVEALMHAGTRRLEALLDQRSSAGRGSGPGRASGGGR